MAHLEEVEDLLLSALDDLDGTLPEADKKLAREYITSGEPGEGLDMIAAHLFEFDRTLSKNTYAKLDRAGRMMEMDPATWTFLESLVR